MKKHAPLIAIFICAAIALVIYLLKDKIIAWFKPKTDDEPQKEIIKEYHTETIIKNNNGNNNNNVTDVPPITDLDKDKILMRGSKGAEVKFLQSSMNNVLKAKKKVQLVVDGAFGQKTETALYFITKKKKITLSEFATIMVQTWGKGL